MKKDVLGSLQKYLLKLMRRKVKQSEVKQTKTKQDKLNNSGTLKAPVWSETQAALI
jgi:hypothetical protein